MAVTFATGTITITDTETLATVFAADQANAWGVMTRTGQVFGGVEHYYYTINAFVVLGNGTTATSLTLSGGGLTVLNASTRTFIIKANASFVVGILTNGVPDNSTDIRILLDQDRFYLEGSGRYTQYGGSFFAQARVNRETNAIQGTIQFYYCDIKARDSFTRIDSLTIENSYIHHSNAVAVKIDKAFTSFKSNTIASNLHAFQLIGASLTVELADIFFISNTNHIIANRVSLNSVVTFLDPNQKDLIISSSSTTTDIIRVAFRFDLIVSGFTGQARLYLRDQQNTQVFNNLISSGTAITQQKLLYKQWSGSNTATVTTFADHFLRVRRYGFQQVTQTVVADKRNNLTLTLAVDTNTQLTEANASTVTGVTVDFINNTITFSGVSVRNAYDYVRWLLTQSANIQYVQDFTTDGLGNYFLSLWTPIFSGANALTGTGVIQTPTKTAQYINGGGTQLAVIDSTGMRFRIFGLPTTGTARARLKKLSNNEITYHSFSNAGELYLQLALSSQYELRVDDIGYYGQKNLEINTANQNFLELELEPVKNFIYGLATPAEKALYSIDPVTFQLSIAYSSDYPILSWTAASEFIEEFYNTNAGLNSQFIVRFDSNTVIFAENTAIRIIPNASNTSNVVLGYLIKRDAYSTPHSLFLDSNAPRILYDVTQNVALFSGQVTATTDNMAIANAVESVLADNFAAIPTNPLLTNDIRLADFARKADIAPAVRAELTTELARLDTPISSRSTNVGVWSVATRTLSSSDNIVLAKNTGITGFNDPSATAIANQVESQLTDNFAAIQLNAPTVGDIVTGLEGSILLAKQAKLDALDDRLTTARAGYLDKLNVVGTLAHSADANTYKADVNGLLTASSFATANTSLTNLIGTRATNQSVWEYSGDRTLTTSFPDLTNVNTTLELLTIRLSASRAGYLDKLNVSGTLANSDNATFYQADTSRLATATQINALPSAVWTYSDNRTLTSAFPQPPSLAGVENSLMNLTDRLTVSRASYLDKLNVTGALAHSDNANPYKADVSNLSTTSQVNALPQSIWSYSTRSLTSFGSLVPDIVDALVSSFESVLSAISPKASQASVDSLPKSAGLTNEQANQLQELYLREGLDSSIPLVINEETGEIRAGVIVLKATQDGDIVEVKRDEA